MEFTNFKEFREYIRRYNSNSILKIGTHLCWRQWYSLGTKLSPDEWLRNNARRNYALRLMLLASAGNPHKQKDITFQEFEDLINIYYKWNHHTIFDKSILDAETDNIFNHLRKLSKFLNKEVIRQNVAGLFLQRQAAFQNSGFGKPNARIERTIKLLRILNKNELDKHIRSFNSSYRSFST